MIKLATEVFNSRDYKSLKVADFCKGMDLPTGTFYEYFENIEDLCVYLASLTFQKKFDELGKNNIALFTYEEEGFAIEKKEEDTAEITYEKKALEGFARYHVESVEQCLPVWKVRRTCRKKLRQLI